MIIRPFVGGAPCLYAGGVTVRQIEQYLATTIGVELFEGTISAITDAVGDAVSEWQNRPLEQFYPVIYLDAIHLENGSSYLSVGESDTPVRR